MSTGKSFARAVGDVFTGGMFTARRMARKARRTERRAQEELDRVAEAERTRRRNIQRAALQRGPTMFDLLRGPGG